MKQNEMCRRHISMLIFPLSSPFSLLLLILLLLFFLDASNGSKQHHLKHGPSFLSFPDTQAMDKGHNASYHGRLPIVYVYTVVPAVCKHGLPSYIRTTLEHALLMQPDCDVVMASNYAECPAVATAVEGIPGLKIIDIANISSPRTKLFSNLSSEIFQSDYKGELWVTSALRFFNMDDIMVHEGYPEMLHVEADNLVYGRLSSLLPTLRQHYKGLAATPLNDRLSFITASVFWVSHYKALNEFTNTLLDIAQNTSGTLKDYYTWLRPHACCKSGGVDQDAHGQGIKPFAVNEMSMLAYYRNRFPEKLKLLPVVPPYNYPAIRGFNISAFSPEGSQVAHPTGRGIWDSNSWGQFLGGTHQKRGRNKGFIDSSHISGLAMKHAGCVPKMICIPRSDNYTEVRSFSNHTFTNSSGQHGHSCITAPHARCQEDQPWSPLWNLHVHSKHTDKFSSQPCPCEDEDQLAGKNLLQIANVTKTSSSGTRLPIVYVYTVVPAVCKHGLPQYIRTTLEQALLTQSDCDIIMASNYAECPIIANMVAGIPGLKTIDIAKIASPRTMAFQNLSHQIFQKDGFGELWITSALRFFNMEDIMLHEKYGEMFHVEADNLLYGQLSSIIDVFRQKYTGMAATPLNSDVSFVTASVFWIPTLDVLKRFTDHLMSLASSEISFKKYLTWLRPFACCKRGGVDQDKDGNGIKPFAINEMSMIAHYHSIRPREMFLLPVVPHAAYNLNRYVCNMSEYGPNGPRVGPATGHGIWDPNSWGQYIGGTSSGRGNDVGFTDSSHIAGQAIRTTGCRVAFNCTTHAYPLVRNMTASAAQSALPYYATGNSTHRCLTAPHVQCSDNSRTWTLLWNLHVHSKHTHKFISRPCVCPSGGLDIGLAP